MTPAEILASVTTMKVEYTATVVGDEFRSRAFDNEAEMMAWVENVMRGDASRWFELKTRVTLR